MKCKGAVSRLIKAGIDLDIRDVHNCTAFDLAKETDYQIARELFDAGAKGDAPDHGYVSIFICNLGIGRSPIADVLEHLARELQSRRAPNPWSQRGHLLVGFIVPGRGECPDFQGLRPGRVVKAHKFLDVDVAVPDPAPSGEAGLNFVLSSLREAVPIARERFRRNKIEFAADAVLKLIDAIENSTKRSHKLTETEVASAR
jgi:hypothetical protein